MSATATPAMSRFALPGFGLPLNFKPAAATYDQEAIGEGKDLFPNALDTTDIEYGSTSLELTTIREFTMLRIMNQLTDQPDWHIKVFDEEIATKWKAEALATEGQDVTQKMVDWCIAELRYKAGRFKESGAITVYDADVIKSDTAIPQDLKQALRDAIKVLEDVPSRLKDCRLGSDGKVLDLVHPSLFPLVFGRSRILDDKIITLEDCIKRTGEGKIILVPPEKETRYREPIQSLNWRRERQVNPFSRIFQWLPCDVELSDNSQDIKIASYINNLHPYDHKELYGVLEKIIARTIPLWNQSLTGLKARYARSQRVMYGSVEYDPDPEEGPEEVGPQQEDGEDEDDYWERREQWYRDTRLVIRPEPGEFQHPNCGGHIENEYFDENGQLKPEQTVDIFRDYKERGIQVIVKLANIHLTPEKPEYEGGTWRVEGQLNEHICASAIYCYDSENITTSGLTFRQQVSHHATHEIDYRENQHEWFKEVFGCEHDNPCVQEMGSVATPENRPLTWPNILQRQVQPFELADPTKPGHRKILALFLVDPHIRIISTANVPCQRADWWAVAIRKLTNKVNELPPELQDKIYKDVDFPFTTEEAKEIRLKFMDERRSYIEGMDDVFKQNNFSLC